jgi:hypothetical protein
MLSSSGVDARSSLIIRYLRLLQRIYQE